MITTTRILLIINCCILIVLPIAIKACPPDCGDCHYWDGDSCDYSCFPTYCCYGACRNCCLSSQCGDCEQCSSYNCSSYCSSNEHCCDGSCRDCCDNDDCSDGKKCYNNYCKECRYGYDSDCPGDCMYCNFYGSCEKKADACPDGECWDCGDDGWCYINTVGCESSLGCRTCDENGYCVIDTERCGECGVCNTETGWCEDSDDLCLGECDFCVGGECLPDPTKCDGYVGCCYGKECCAVGEICCEDGHCLVGCESCIDGVTIDDKEKCTGECNNCIDGQCQYDDALCDPGGVCVEGTCCDTASAGDCSVTDEDIGYDEDDCIWNSAGAGQCMAGLGSHIAGYSQSSTHENATGPGTVDVAGCADVAYFECQTIFTGLDDQGYWWDCVVWPSIHTENMGTHDGCPTE